MLTRNEDIHKAHERSRDKLVPTQIPRNISTLGMMSIVFRFPGWVRFQSLAVVSEQPSELVIERYYLTWSCRLFLILIHLDVLAHPASTPDYVSKC